MWAVTESGIDPQATGARGAGLATVVSGAAGPGGTVLDTWFPAPELVPASQASGTARLSLAEAAEALGPDVARAARPGRGPGGRGRRGPHHHRQPGRAPGRRARRVPAAAPAVRPPDPPARLQPGRRLRDAGQRGVDQPRAVPGPGLRGHPAAAAPPRPGRRVRRGQVPPDGGLRAAGRGADRGRGPGPAGRPPGRGDHGHARGLRQLQRGHPRHVHGGRPDLGRRGRRGRLRRGRRRVDHGHPVRWRQGDDLGR